jgi:hypothetical protein
MPYDDDPPAFETDLPLVDGVADTMAEAVCPCCGEPVRLVLDPGGGRRQEYVEDCEVCCRPWNVRVVYREGGGADVRLEPADGD